MTGEKRSIRLGVALSVPGLELADAITYAGRLEAAGVDTIGVGEATWDGYVSAAAMAVATRSTRIMSAVASWHHPPALAARAAARVHGLAPGRYVLGLGAGVPNTRDQQARPLSRMRSYLAAVRGDMAFPGLPVHLAAARPGMARLAGEVADGVLISRVHTIDWLRKVIAPAVEDGEKTSSRRIERGVLVRCAVTDDREAAIRSLRDEVSRSSPQLLTEVAAVGAREPSEAEHLSDGFVSEMCVVGAPEECYQQIRRYEGLVDWISLFPGGDPVPRTAVDTVVEMIERL